MTLYDNTSTKIRQYICFAFIILPETPLNNFTATIPVNVGKDLINKKKVETEGLVYKVNKCWYEFY